MMASITVRHMTSELTIRTLQKSLDSQPSARDGLILHSGQGTQYSFRAFTKFCEFVNATQSISKTGHPYDDAPMEHYFNI